MSTTTQGIEIRLSATGGPQVNAAIAGITGAAQRLNGVFKAMSGAAFATGIGAVLAGGAALGRAMQSGIAFNAELEQSILGIAAVQKQLNPERFRTFQDAIQTAEAAVGLLQDRAKSSPASFSELVEGFQSITGAATQAGIPLKKQIDLVVLMSQALAGLGIRSDQITQEARALLTGNITEDAMAAKMLGITKKQIDDAKEAGTLFEFLSGRMSSFAEAGAYGARTFRTLASNIRDAMEQASAIAAGPLFEQIKLGMERINSIDFAGMGQRFAAFSRMVIEDYKSGRITETIADLIEAGFEAGTKAAGRLWDATWAVLSDKKLWKSVGLIFVAELTGALKTLASFMTWLTLPLTTLGDYLASVLTLAFAKAVNSFQSGLEGVINRVGRMFGAKPMGFDRMQEVTPTLAASWGRASQARNDSLSWLNSKIDMGAVFARAWLGFEKRVNEAGEAVSALELVSARIKALMGGPAKGVLPDEASRRPAVPPAAQGLDPLLVEREQLQAIADLEEGRRRVDGDFMRTDREKYRARQLYLDAEIGAREELVGFMRDQAALEPNPAARQGLLSRADAIDKERRSRVADREAQGPDPDSFMQQFGGMLKGLETQWGSWAQQVASNFATVFNQAIGTISSNITGLIMQTKSWGQALVSIGNTILTSVINAIVEMGVRWVMTRGIVGMANILWSGKEALAAAPKAMMESISSYGVAALVGAAAFAGVMALAGGFADGGWISGPGGPRDDQVMARLSPGEFVVNAAAASRHSALLEAINSGSDASSSGGYRQMPEGGTRGASATVILVDDMKTAVRMQMEHPDGQAVIHKINRRGKIQSGLAT